MAKAINETTLRHWMEKLGPRLITISTGICRDRHQAEEIVQEAFIKLWRSPPDAGEIAFTSWLRRVVTNLSINALKRTRRPGALPEYSQDPAMHTGDRPEAQRRVRERVDLVSTALERLDPAKRTILVLRAVQKLSYDEIAEHLSVPIGTVMSRLNRARLALADEMRAIEQEQQTSGDTPDVYPFRQYRRA
ncbi:MAG: RNA polymerase sigma factor [Planctomycetota bacterium]|jgi:RNA polymerase sigma-70 factor (ECF subfamily)